jgi:hypothetical protein
VWSTHRPVAGSIAAAVAAVPSRLAKIATTVPSCSSRTRMAIAPAGSGNAAVSFPVDASTRVGLPLRPSHSSPRSSKSGRIPDAPTRRTCPVATSRIAVKASESDVRTNATERPSGLTLGAKSHTSGSVSRRSWLVSRSSSAK